MGIGGGIGWAAVGASISAALLFVYGSEDSGREGRPQEAARTEKPARWRAAASEAERLRRELDDLHRELSTMEASTLPPPTVSEQAAATTEALRDLVLESVSKGMKQIEEERKVRAEARRLQDIKKEYELFMARLRAAPAVDGYAVELDLSGSQEQEVKRLLEEEGLKAEALIRPLVPAQPREKVGEWIGGIFASEGYRRIREWKRERWRSILTAKQLARLKTRFGEDCE